MKNTCKSCNSLNTKVIKNNLCAECLQHEDIKTKLIEKAKLKPIQEFIQYDGFTNVHFGMPTDCDSDGDWLCKGNVKELRISDCVRLQIPVNMYPLDALRAIEKIYKWVKKDVCWEKDTALPVNNLDI